jgi:hypothetical protein
VPKLEATHLPPRISARLADLKAGKAVSIRDIKALLSDEQIAAMEAAWQEQQELRKEKKAKTKEEEKELGWKSKRDIYIETYERASADSEKNLLAELKKKIKEVEVKAAKTYLDAFFEAKSEDKEYFQADAAGRNALTRAGFVVDPISQKLKAKLKDDLLMEKKLEKIIKAKMTKEELEQYELLQEHERNLKNKEGKGK